MKKLKIILTTILGLAMTAAVTTAAAAETDKPAFSGNSIVCGSKTVTWLPEGRIVVRSGDVNLLTLCPQFYYQTPDKKKVDWYSFTAKECKVGVEDGKVVWKLKKQLNGTVYDAGSQTLEILPDGLLKVQSRIQVIQADGWVPRTQKGLFFIFVPYAQADGKDLILNGQTSKLDSNAQKGFFNNWRDKQFNYVFYPGDDARTIVLNGVKPEVGHATGCGTDKYNKAFRVTLEMNKEMSCTFTLDLRKPAAGK